MRLACVGMGTLQVGAAAWSAGGCSLECMGLQPAEHRAPPSGVGVITREHTTQLSAVSPKSSASSAAAAAAAAAAGSRPAAAAAAAPPAAPPPARSEEPS